MNRYGMTASDPLSRPMQGSARALCGRRVEVYIDAITQVAKEFQQHDPGVPLRIYVEA